MSFILDALKKSETERQQQGAAEFSGVPVSTNKPRTPKWLWILGILLAINVVALTSILVRTDAPPPSPSPSPVSIDSGTTTKISTTGLMVAAPEIAESTFAERVVAAKDKQSARESQPMSANSQAQRAEAVDRPNPATSSPYLRTFDEARVQGLFQMTDLHLDIHVFGEFPADRFVFINMAKHRQGSQLAEGPTVSEITTDGVILEYQGTTFLLPRE